MKNDGKRWEKCISNSCKEDKIFCKKLSDGTSSWSKNDSKVRFQKNNECDFIIYGGGNKLLLVEAKCHKGKSLPLNCIRQNQIDGMFEKSKYENVVCGLLVLFSEVEKAYFLKIEDFIEFMHNEHRKSIPIEYFEKEGISVQICKKITNYYVDILHLYELLELPF